jgi:hypothetical protein
MENLMGTDACTMPTEDRSLRLAEFDALFSEAVQSVERAELSVRMHLKGPSGLRETVRDLAERETACCSFFTFVVDGTDADLTLDVTVPQGRADILDGLADRAIELSA